MSTPATIQARLREAKAEALGLFNTMDSISFFIGSGIARQMPANEGFLKLAGLSAPGRMNEKSGFPGQTAAKSGLDSASREVAGQTFYKTIQIDNDLLLRTDAIARGEVSRIIREQSMVVGGEIDRQLSALLIANGAWMSGSAMFSSTNGPIPGSGITFDNLENSAGSSAANQKTNYYKWVSFNAKIMNAMNYAQNNPSSPPVPVLMHPADIAEGVDDAFNITAPGAAIATQNRVNKVRTLINPYLTDAADNWYFNTSAGSAFFAVGMTRQPEIKVWEDYDNDCWNFKVIFGAAFAPWNVMLGFMCT